VAELERKNLALERLTGLTREVGLSDPDAEDEERAEIDLLDPEARTFARVLAQNEELLHRPPQMGKITAQ
jgi:hypothetical protein